MICQPCLFTSSHALLFRPSRDLKFCWTISFTMLSRALRQNVIPSRSMHRLDNQSTDFPRCDCCCYRRVPPLSQVFVSFGALAEGEGGGSSSSSSERAPVFLRRWGAHVNHFLGYFPYPDAKPVILPLVELRRSLAPCFAALPAGDKGRAREGTPSKDDAPSPKNTGSEVFSGGSGGGNDGNTGQSHFPSM